MKKKIIIIFCVLILLVSLSAIFIKTYIKVHISSIPRWSIGLVKYDSTFTLKEENIQKVFSGSNVPLNNSYFVADPSIIKNKDKYYLFFENGIITEDSWKGVIDLAISNDLTNWEYGGTVLNEINTVAFPIVYEFNNEYYMTIDSSGLGNLIIYKAIEFPNNWECVDTLLTGEWSDPYILYHEDVYWLFASKRFSYEPHLFYSDNFLGPYTEHQQNPLIDNSVKYGRNAGKIFYYNNKLFRPVQDCSEMYGEMVRLMEITELSKDTYKEKEINNSPVLFAGQAKWNSKKMHTLNHIETISNELFFIVDGTYVNYDKKISIFRRKR